MSFTYDATGRMTSRTEGTQTQYYVYDAYSMLIGVYEDQNLTQPIVAHVYDDRGQRVQKDSYQGGALAKRTYYVRDVGGNVLAIYEQDVASSQPTAEVAEYPIYGLGRIGSWYALPGGTLALDGYQITDGDEDLPQYVPGTTPNYLYQGEDVVTLQQGFEVSWQTATDNMFHVAPLFALRDENSELYELTDHLGNVRVTVGREKAVDNTAETIGYTDYYPFGQPLPSQRSVGSPKYRFGFQGAFAEDETEERGVVAFELRDWDPVIGRWLAPDPMGQYASPYLGMGNSPVNRIDPDGGFDEWNIINGERQWVSISQ